MPSPWVIIRSAGERPGDLVSRPHAPGDRIGRHGPRQHHRGYITVTMPPTLALMERSKVAS